ncbi:MAG: endonuclease/exonuclease/phosphatase family protein [Candidatus Dojkabacteria bacterium]|nr:endonuclease/exonuclease/phosphatase family protein [Candidatus Dojkabacteria bacterium]
MTYNVRGGLWTPEHSKKLARLVMENDVDILFLQEVVRFFNDAVPDDGECVLKGLKAALGKEFGIISYTPAQSENESSGNAIVYRKKTATPLGGFHRGMFAKVSQRSLLEERVSKILVASRRVIMSGKFRIGGRIFIMYNVHLDYFGGDARRVYQLKRMFSLWERTRSKTGVIEIIAGDFNTWLPARLMRMFRKLGRLYRFLTKSGFIEVSQGVDWTQVFKRDEMDKFTENGAVNVGKATGIAPIFDGHFKQKLDHIWARGDIEATDCRRIDTDLSDHYPLMVTLHVNEPTHA